MSVANAPYDLSLWIEAGDPNHLNFKWTWPVPVAYNPYHDTDVNSYKYARIQWDYMTPDGMWTNGEDSYVGKNEVWDEATDVNHYLISTPDNWIEMRARIRPCWSNGGSDTTTWSVYDLDWDDLTLYWGWTWSDYAYCAKSNTLPEDPTTPSLSVDSHNTTLLTAKVDVTVTTESTTDAVLFEIADEFGNILTQTAAPIVTGSAQITATGAHGRGYRARCKTINYYDNNKNAPIYSYEYSDYSDMVYTSPEASTTAPTVTRRDSTSVVVSWPAVTGNALYTVQYTQNRYDFDDGSGYSTKSTTDYGTTSLTIDGLDSGNTYYFRYTITTYDSSGTEIGTSEPSPITTVGVGKKPNIPTTWSSTSTVISGETVRLYWTHNASDSSRESSAYLKLNIVSGSSTKEVTYTITNTKTEEEDTGIYSYEIDTSGSIEGITLAEGATIDWCVATCGIAEVGYSEWSITREVKIYTKPELTLQVPSPVQSYPVSPIIQVTGGNQTPVSYYVTIEATSNYMTIANTGEDEQVVKGQRLYYAFFNSALKNLTYDINVNDVNLDNSQTYKMTASVNMDSGLSAEASLEFTVQWSQDDGNLYPRIERMIPNSTLKILSFQIGAKNDAGEWPDYIQLAIYRKTFDGKFVTVGENLPNTNSYVTDPHPQFNAAAYRIVSTNMNTGDIRYTDVTGIPTHNNAVVLQWNETWTNLQRSSDTIDGGVTWSGMRLEIPYNIDVSDNSEPDVELKEYIGREHPVSYYGTQLGSTATWNVEIPKSDTETLAMLRKLQTWMGDVYVREPSGSGYWAQVTTSFSQTHCELTIPVTFDIKRVEGGL